MPCWTSWTTSALIMSFQIARIVFARVTDADKGRI